MKYNRWTVLEKLPSKGSGNGHVQFRCRCVCGTERVVRACLVIQSKSKSCGCWKSELRRQNKLKHGQAKTKDHPPTSEYMSYTSAKSRCTNPNNQAWSNYGGRGIEFRFESFEKFFAELGKRPEGKELDRIDNDGHYESGNVRWATRNEQCNNRRPIKSSAGWFKKGCVPWNKVDQLQEC